MLLCGTLEEVGCPGVSLMISSTTGCGRFSGATTIAIFAIWGCWWTEVRPCWLHHIAVVAAKALGWACVYKTRKNKTSKKGPPRKEAKALCGGLAV